MDIFRTLSDCFKAERLSFRERRFAFCFSGSPLRRGLPRLTAVLALLALVSCTPSGRPVAGLAEGSSWFSLPFDKFLHEGDAAPEAMSFCTQPECPARLAVGVLAVTGSSARQLERILRRPGLLTAELDARARKPTLKRAVARGNPRHIATALAVTPLRHGQAEGFSLTMNRKDGKGFVASTVLGWQEGETLHVVIAIGENSAAVTDAAIRTVERYDGPAAQ